MAATVVVMLARNLQFLFFSCVLSFTTTTFLQLSHFSQELSSGFQQRGSNFLDLPAMRASSRMTLHPTPPPQPLLRSINHACKFKDDITPHPPTPTPVQGWRCHEKRGKSAGRFSTRRLKLQYSKHSINNYG